MHVLPVSTPPQHATKLEIARALLVDAQGVAADAINDPASMTQDLLSRGVQDAFDASAMLLEASPRSRFQDLIEASSHARAGAEALVQAVNPWSDELPEAQYHATVKEQATLAYDAFERAFEIIDND